MMKSRREKLPVAALERIDDACIEFEKAHQRGEQPDIELVLAKANSPEERAALLAELLALDFDYRQKRGEQPETQEYCNRFPEDEGVIQRALSDVEDPKNASRFEPPSIAHLAELFPSLEILEFIGAGGMGAVYKARQKGLDRLVAIKILPDEVGRDVKFALRFTREARALARLSHPHIVSIYEFGNAEGTYYFLMEYVNGSTLRELIRSKQLKPEQALAIVPHLCEALQYAHDQGVLHRDIKPENILLDASGEVKIADFGLSRLLGNSSTEDRLTGTHQVMGTLRYMAPEQMEGAHGVDHRADIYSLGVVFYEMLTGELPMGHFAVPSQKASIDIRLDEVVLHTLEKEPARRYQHASEIKTDVESIVSTAGQRAATTSHPDATGKPATENAETASLEKQERAARVLILRRELMSRVESSLKPLFRGQIVQMMIGVAFIAGGVMCWAPNVQVTHRLVSGGLLHAYGVLLVLAAGVTCARIRRFDYSKSVDGVRSQLARIRDHYLRSGAWLGFSWWLLWMPLAVAVGFESVLYPTAFWISIIIGLLGLFMSLVLYARLLRSRAPLAEKWKRGLAGESLCNAENALEEIAGTEMR